MVKAHLTSMVKLVLRGMVKAWLGYDKTGVGSMVKEHG
jgi:hypothetical protein